jgi:hypothetical protein
MDLTNLQNLNSSNKLNHIKLKTYLKSHGFRLQGSITPNMTIIGPIFDPKPRLFQISDESCTLKKICISICDPIMPRTLWTKKEMWKNCIAWFAHQTRGFSIFVGTTLIIIDIITIQFSRWTWLHCHLIQFSKTKVIFNYY